MAYCELGIDKLDTGTGYKMPDMSFNADVVPNLITSAGQFISQGMDFASAERQRRHDKEIADINAQIANAQTQQQRYAAQMQLQQLQNQAQQEQQQQTTLIIIISSVAVLGLGAILLATSKGKK